MPPTMLCHQSTSLFAEVCGCGYSDVNTNYHDVRYMYHVCNFISFLERDAEQRNGASNMVG